MPDQRITIWGNSGSGKSTLAEAVGRELGLPVFHLDLIAWEAGWRFRNEAAFLEAQKAWLVQPCWIIEGIGGWHGLIERFSHADLIIHLDTPCKLCHERATLRITADRTAKNRFMAEGCRYEDVVPLQTEVIDHFEAEVRPAIESILATEFVAKSQHRLDGTNTTAALCQELIARFFSD